MKAIDEVDCDSAQHFLRRGGNTGWELGGWVASGGADAALARQAPRLLPG